MMEMNRDLILFGSLVVSMGVIFIPTMGPLLAYGFFFYGLAGVLMGILVD